MSKNNIKDEVVSRDSNTQMENNQYSHDVVNNEDTLEMMEGYEHIHPDIARLLLKNSPQQQIESRYLVDSSTLTLQYRGIQDNNNDSDTTNISSIEELSWLADNCDCAIYNRKSAYDVHISKKILGLIQLSELNESSVNQEPAVLVATMIALNLLESSIRSLVMDSKRRKGAPLLSDMIQEIESTSASHLVPILRALLLPTRLGGINLRNLVSHGFISSINRRWLSLTLVLIQSVDSFITTPLETESVRHEKSSLLQYEPMARQVQHGKSILLDELLDELERKADDFIPPSHMNLLRFSLQELAPTPTLNKSLESMSGREKSDTIQQSSPRHFLTAIFNTVICSLLEHSLRLLWCKANNRPRDCIARPSEYYVTLDGHGQRDKHEVMITPFLSDGKTRNKLIHVIGAETITLLTDLFASPSLDAPNIRSALCHGRYDDIIISELEGLVTAECPQSSDTILMDDTACALISCLELITSNISGESIIERPFAYRPVYSYTAEAVRDLKDVLQNLESLESMIKNPLIINCIESMEVQHHKLYEDMQALEIDLESIKEMACDLLGTKTDDEPLAVEDMYTEHQTNIMLADNIAAQALISDVSRFTKSYVKGVEERLDNLALHPTNTKDRRILKTSSRFCSLANICCKLYTFSVYISLVSMKKGLDGWCLDDKLCKDDLIKAVERTRMTISTFDSYSTTNLDRSLKALQQYLQGKAVKKVILQKNQT